MQSREKRLEEHFVNLALEMMIRLVEQVLVVKSISFALKFIEYSVMSDRAVLYIASEYLGKTILMMLPYI